MLVDRYTCKMDYSLEEYELQLIISYNVEEGLKMRRNDGRLSLKVYLDRTLLTIV